MNALLAYADAQETRKIERARKRLQGRRERARLADEANGGKGPSHSLLVRLDGTTDRAHARAQVGNYPRITFCAHVEVNEPLDVTGWDVIDDLAALPRTLSKQQGADFSAATVAPPIPDEAGYRSALRAQAVNDPEYGPADQQWAVMLLIDGDVYKYVYIGRLSRLRAYVCD
jgi:hypothetical protein